MAALAKAYPAHRIAAAQRYDAPSRNLTAHRVELRDGASEVVTWTDGRGHPITKDDLLDAVEALGR